MTTSESAPYAVPTRHAVLVVAAGLVALAVGRPWPLALGAALSFAWVIAEGRGRFTPDGSFGAANAVTLFRLALVLSLNGVLYGAPPWWITGVTVAAMLLDIADGWLARRAGQASEFGAAFDVETDALLALALGVELCLRGRFAAWILWPGLLRYAYVLVLSVWPARGGPAPRSLLGRTAYFLLLIGLLGGLLLPGLLGLLCAVTGTLLVSASFARSFHAAYAPSAR